MKKLTFEAGERVSHQNAIWIFTGYINGGLVKIRKGQDTKTVRSNQIRRIQG